MIPFGDSDFDYLKNHVRNVRELQFQTLDGSECGSDRIELSRTRLLVTIDDLEFGGEFAQQIEAFAKLVTDGQGHIDSFFSGVLSFVSCGSF